MKNFIKRILLLLTGILCLMLVGCGSSEKTTLDRYLCELRSDVFEGEADGITLKAAYGFKNASATENTSDRIYKLFVRLDGDVKDDATYHVAITYNGKEYKNACDLLPSGAPFTAFEIPDFTEKEFTATVICGSDVYAVTLKSLLPDGTVACEQMLSEVFKSQKELINKYIDEDGNFRGSICARVLVRKEKPYWYVGFISEQGDVKAFLVDGITCDVLAVREIY